MKGFRLCVALALALLAAGCQSAPEPPAYPAIRFTDGEPIRLDVARIEVIEAYRPPLAAPNVDHLFPIPPINAAAQWARDRLRAVGTAGRAEAVIRDASAKEVALKKTTGIRGMLTTDQSERYDGTIEIEVRIFDAAGRQVGNAIAKADRSRTVPEDITLRDRETVWYEMTAQMMKTVDEALVRRIRGTLGRFVR